MMEVPDISEAAGPQAQASAHMACRHAAAVAAASIEKKLTTTLSTSETVQLTRSLTELQKCSLQSELGFMDTLLDMNEEEVLYTLFSLFDSDGSGSVDKNELARNLKKLDQRSLSESLDIALLSIHVFDSDGDGCMDHGEFADFLEDLVNGLECSLADLAQFLTLRVAFCDNGTAILDDAIVALVQDSTTSVMSVEDFDDAVVEVRMLLLVGCIVCVYVRFIRVTAKHLRCCAHHHVKVSNDGRRWGYSPF
jgi:Ca2+-binding EF-hand superfamily protein